ncbi:hypothetical protein KO566_09040 [Flavobacteriaceae bacterium XHP0103]|nr:hypothetical protein [Marixanthotalea marina]
MKFYISVVVLILFVVSAQAQIDSRNNSFSIPAVETPNDSTNTIEANPIEPIAPENNQSGLDGLSLPKKNSSQFSLPKKEFSMTDREEFGNPAELYKDRLDKHMNDIKEEMYLGTVGSSVDQHFGEFRTKSKFIYVQYRDYGQQDGDLIRIFVNNEMISPRVLLTNSFKGFVLDLKPGRNAIDFLALNEGYALPNTAHFRILDEDKHVIASDMWALSIDVKATIVIIKE